MAIEACAILSDMGFYSIISSIVFLDYCDSFADPLYSESCDHYFLNWDHELL